MSGLLLQFNTQCEDAANGMWNECGDAGQKEGYRLGISGLHLVCHQPVTHPQNPLVEGLPKHWASASGDC